MKSIASCLEKRATFKNRWNARTWNFFSTNDQQSRGNGSSERTAAPTNWIAPSYRCHSLMVRGVRGFSYTRTIPKFCKSYPIRPIANSEICRDVPPGRFCLAHIHEKSITFFLTLLSISRNTIKQTILREQMTYKIQLGTSHFVSEYISWKVCCNIWPY